MREHLLHRIPLTLKMVLLTLIVGIATWGVLDYFQSRTLKGIFLAQVTRRLNQKAQEDRIRFDNYIKAHHQAVKLLTTHNRFSGYVRQSEWDREGAQPVLSHSQPPGWLPKPSVLRSLVQIRYALLLDAEGRTREVYQGTYEPPPESLLRTTILIRQLSHNQAFMTSINDVPFLLTSESLRDAQGVPRATLMLASPLDEEFLIASQGPHEGSVFALLTGSPHRVLISTHPDQLPPGTELSVLEGRYLVTGKSLFDYGASDLLLGFASFMSLKEVESLISSVVSKDRQQRAIMAIIFIMSFAVIMYWITRRIELLTQRISDFSQRALGGSRLARESGDELSVLEDRFQRLTEEVVSSQEKLIEAEKFSALGRLTANVAHEIRNPLTSIGGFARRLKKKLSSERREKDYADIIASGVDGLETILRNVLTYSRDAPLQVEQHDMNAIIAESLTMYEGLCRQHSIDVRKSFGDVEPIRVDKIQVKETLNNLLSNALDAMPDGGTLTIRTRKEILNSTPYLNVKITDTGKGIPGDQSDMIFEPFFTSRVFGRGTGFGLPICKKIVEDHGGFIRFDSTARTGATFSLYFPYGKGTEFSH